MPLSPSNAILNSLPPAERAIILEAATPVEFRLGDLICEAGDRATHCTFVDEGIISAVAVMADGRTIETFMIGPEGMTFPLAIEAGARAYSRLVAQSDGYGRRVEIGRLRQLADHSEALREAVAAYAVRLTGELEQSSACNALHRAEHRFAKWLLRCHDRVEGDVLKLTQEYLASMLGSQRTTVNEAAQTLQRAGAIRYSRGRVTILDRVALERAACECYGVQWEILEAGIRPPPLAKAG